MEQLLAEEPRPTAAVVWSPTAALPVLAAALGLGFCIPDDLSVVAYNDSPIAGYLGPGLTTVRMPLDEMARSESGACSESPTASARGMSSPTRRPYSSAAGRRRRLRIGGAARLCQAPAPV